MTYENVNNFRVIADDDRDPDVSFAHHRERGSLGGVDVVAPHGTPIYAPDDCVLVNYPNNGSGGNTIQMNFIDGGTDQMMHLSEFVESGFKRKRELVGYSGSSVAPGYNPVDPHVHWHRLGAWYKDEWGSTNRYNPFHYFTSDPAGGDNSNPIEEDDMDNTCIIISAGEDDEWAFYWFDAVKNKKRLIPTDEWNQLTKWNAENGLPLTWYPLAKNLIHGLANF